MKSMNMKLVSSFIGVAPDKYFISLSGDKSSKIVNVTRIYHYHEEIWYFDHIDHPHDLKTKTEDITYEFRYLFENLSTDGSLLLDDLTKHIKFDRLAIDYLKDGKIVKKIIERSMLQYSYIDLDFHSVAIPFGRLEF
jgi:hypothetical protein